MRAYAILVREGLASGLSKAASEQRARDMLFEEHDAVPVDAASQPMSVASLEELWAQLQRTWERRCEQVELVDVLEELNGLLDRGVINGDELGDLLARGHAYVPTIAGRAAKRRQQAQARQQRQAAAAAEATPATTAAETIQKHLRAWRARELFAWRLHEEARKIRQEVRRVAKKKRKVLEVSVRDQLLRIARRWGEDHSQEDLGAIAAIVAQGKKLELKAAGEVATLLAGEETRRRVEVQTALLSRN